MAPLTGRVGQKFRAVDRRDPDARMMIYADHDTEADAAEHQRRIQGTGKGAVVFEAADWEAATR